MKYLKLFEEFDESKLDNIPSYHNHELDSLEKSGLLSAVTFYPKKRGGRGFTIADKVDAMRMYDELEKNNIDGRVVFGPFFHSFGSGDEPKSLTVIVDKNDLKKVQDIIINSDDLDLTPPLHPNSDLYFGP